jgi:formylglycine-generating enzyme required for sulfatase activity
MKRQGRELPEERVLLYEAYIKSLLSDWHRVRSLSRRSLERLSSLAPDPHARRPERVLEDVALWMQETAPGKGLVTEAALRQRLTQAYAESPDCEARVDDFMDQMRGHAGLLVDRGGDRFGFIHLTFMEYLAGRALARQYLDPKLGPQVVVATLAEHLAEPDWRETSLLCLGALSKSHGSPEGAARVIEGLLDREPAAAGEAALLSGLSLADLGADGVTADCYEGTRDRLLKTMPALEGIPARTRIFCGEALAEIGDPRPEVITLDAMQFCWVPAGEFFLGSPENDPDARDNEKEGAGLYRLEYDYWMARHPVTVAQFAAYQAAASASFQRRRRVDSCATAPVVRVSWTEAVAFCRWLSRRWLDAALIPDGWSVGLPSEPEWEKAARGGLQILEKAVVRSLPDLKGPRCELVANAVPRRRWPWDDTFDPDASHHRAYELYGPSPAGCFPRGVSPYGCEDMSGNVWEWTRSIFDAYP